MTNKELAKRIVELVGGTKNVASVTHCITRLRFMLNDDAKADIKAIEALNVLGVQVQGGQFQVIIGNDVSKVYKELIAVYPSLEMGSENKSEEQGKKANWFNRMLGTLSSILVAVLPPVIGGGMLRGIVFLLTNYNILASDSTLAWFLSLISEAMFYFFPFLLAVSAAKKFKTNEYMALALAAALMHPSYMNLIGEDPLPLFFGLQLPYIDYNSSVIPIILGVWALKYVYGFFEKRIHSMLNTIFTPLLTLLVIIPVTLVALAPIGFYGGNFVGFGLERIIEAVPWLAGFIIGSTRPFLVLLGLHHAIRPIQWQQIATFGYTTVTPANFMSTMATATATFAAYVLLKDKKQKSIALSSTISGFLGITEPAVYGILMKYKAALLGTFFGGGIGGMIATMMGARAYASGMPSIITIPIFMGGGVASVMVGLGATLVSSFVITYVLGKTIYKADGVVITEGKEQKAVKADEERYIHNPVAGTIMPIEAVNDKTFASKLLGEGIAVDPSEGLVTAPVNGTVSMVFATKHAIGILDEFGSEILIHIGIDTVKLNGKHFEVMCQEGDVIKVGDVLAKFDHQAIVGEGFDPTVMLVVTNSAQFPKIKPALAGGKVFPGERVLSF